MFGKEAVSVSLKLFIITAVAAFCLAFVNKVTLPVIEKNTALAEQESLKSVLPDAQEFKAIEIPKSTVEGTKVVSASLGLRGTDVEGYVFSVVSNAGYGGDIKVMVGVDKTLAVTRIEILESSETAGLGANASKPEFSGQFEKKTGPLSVVKGKAKNNDEISAISSATITSKAVTACVNAALDAAKEKEDGHIADTTAETVKKFEEIKKETEEQLKNSKGEGAQ